MEPAEDLQSWVSGAFASLGIEADEAERAVIGATWQAFGPGLTALLEIDLGGVEPERDLDPSRAPGL